MDENNEFIIDLKTTLQAVDIIDKEYALNKSLFIGKWYYNADKWNTVNNMSIKDCITFDLKRLCAWRSKDKNYKEITVDLFYSGYNIITDDEDFTPDFNKLEKVLRKKLDDVFAELGFYSVHYTYKKN